MDQESWQVLKDLVKADQTAEIAKFLNDLSAVETVYAVSRLSQDDQSKLLAMLKPADAADLIEEVADAQAVELIEHLPPEEAAHIVDELPSDQQADILR